MNESLGIWLVREESQALATALQNRLKGKIFHPELDSALTQPERFATAYRSHTHWVILAATGITVRFLDGLMQNKKTDPAVVVLDEAGRYATSLIGGHEAGANQLAYLVANAIGATPVISTATESLKPLVLGVGCRKNVSVECIEAAVYHALEELSLNQVRELATIDLKAEEPGLIKFCEQYHLPLRILNAETIAARPWVTQPSNWVRQNIGLDGVCEPCALIACGRGKLIVPKTALDGVAVAIVKDIGWRRE